MCENFKKALERILDKKRFELLCFLCENVDENDFVMIKISKLEKKLGQSKSTITASFKFLGEKKLFRRLKNGFYQLNL